MFIMLKNILKTYLMSKKNKNNHTDQNSRIRRGAEKLSA